MSEVSNTESLTKMSQMPVVDVQTQESKIEIEDSPYRPKQYSEDNREYYDLYNKKDSMIDNEVSMNDHQLTLNLQESSGSPLTTNKNIYMLRALSKLSRRDANRSSLVDKSPKAKPSLKLIKNINGSSVILDKDDSTPKLRFNENNDSFFKNWAHSGLDGSEPRSMIHKNAFFGNNYDMTQLDFSHQICEEANKSDIMKENETQYQGENNTQPLQNQFQFRKQGTQALKQVQKENKLNKILSNFNKLNNIKKFAQKMAGLSPQYNYRKLKEFHFEVIGDVIQIIFQQFLKDKEGKSLFVIKPNEIFSVIWEIFEILFIFFQIIAFGFRFGYGIILNQYITIFSICFLITDLIITLNTGYYQGIEIVTDRLKIFKYNIFNIIMIIVSLVALMLSDKGPIQFVFIFRFRWLYRSYNHFEQNFQIKQKHPVAATLLRLFIIIILLAHYNACLYFYFTQNLNNSGPTWLDIYGIANATWQTQYLTALYFSFITMVTVGYGDIVPNTQNEKVYIIVFVLISAITFAYVVNTIGSLFQELSRLEGKYDQKKYEIMNYMQERKISKSIQISVVNFLDYTIRQEKELQYSLAGEAFLQSIPLKLRQQVYQEYYGRILQEIKLFSMNFSKEFLISLSVLMREKTYGPGEEIYRQGDKNNTFFFINKGHIEFDIELQGKNIINIGSLKKGDSFNHQGLFCDYSHDLTARCKQITQIIYLSQEDFQRILKQNKDEYEKYCMIKDKFLSENFSLGEKCLSCQKFNHSALACNLIKYSPNSSNLIAKNQYSQPIVEREKHQRKIQIKYNCLVNHNDIKQSMRLLRIQLTYMILGEKLGQFQELVDMVQTDKQFYKYFPQIKMTSENFIFINTVNDLSGSSDSESIDNSTINQNTQANPNIVSTVLNSQIGRDPAKHDTFLLRVGKPQNSELHSQFSGIQQPEKPSLIEDLTETQIKRFPSNLYNNGQNNNSNINSAINNNELQTNENSVEDESQGFPSKNDVQNQAEKNDRGFHKMTSLKIQKESATPPTQQSKMNRRVSVLPQGPFPNIQQQQLSFHNLINSHQDINNLLSFNEGTLLTSNNLILQQILSHLQLLVSNGAHHHTANVNNIGSLSQMQPRHYLSTQNPDKKGINVKSLTQIKQDQQLNINVTPSVFPGISSYSKIPTNPTNTPQTTAFHNQQMNTETAELNEKFYLQFDFDLFKEYKYYFPSFNYPQTIMLYNQNQEKLKKYGNQMIKRKSIFFA